MKFIHLSDLHIGKRLMDTSLPEEQKHIFDAILSVIDAEQPDAVLICGDVYDRSMPGVEAVTLLDDLLNRLKRKGKPVLMIAGNHDSPERLAYGREFLREGGITVSHAYNSGNDEFYRPVHLDDEFGGVDFWLLPYADAGEVSNGEGGHCRDAEEAVRAMLGRMDADFTKRNVILSHQFITGSVTCDSERTSVGSLENVPAQVYDGFDYVALGHLHRPQNIGRADGTMRYCGTPLVYSKSEIGFDKRETRGDGHGGRSAEETPDKSVTVVEMREKGNITVREVPLKPLHTVRLVRGLFEDVIRGPAPGREQDMYYIELTDDTEVPFAVQRLEEMYPRLLNMVYDNRRTRAAGVTDAPEDLQEKGPGELMRELYLKMNGAPMSGEAERFLDEVLKETLEHWEGGVNA